MKEIQKNKIKEGMKRYWDKKGRNGTIQMNGYKTHGSRLKRKYEHRIIMEQYLGRELSINEHVHHKDGNKLNNKIENLEVIERRKHLSMEAKKRGFGKDRKGIAPKNKKSDREIQRICKMRREGKTLKEISFETKFSMITIIKYLRENNINFKLNRWRKRKK